MDRAILKKVKKLDFGRLTRFLVFLFLALTATALFLEDNASAERFALGVFYCLTLTVIFDIFTSPLKKKNSK